MLERLETFGFQRREEINTEKHNREQSHKSKNITRKMWQNVIISISCFLSPWSFISRHSSYSCSFIGFWKILRPCSGISTKSVAKISQPPQFSSKIIPICLKLGSVQQLSCFIQSFKTAFFWLATLHKQKVWMTDGCVLCLMTTLLSTLAYIIWPYHLKF